ncbi:MAG: DNA gyrase inhibitor YacG [Acidobacteria bacterium]|nr:DNA gyrase inhibitor YacG [Acidobacteriota bacterium]MBV9484148.1 DNA gyrase inhibitor YacG [Acidobacteriota bacterium]
MSERAIKLHCPTCGKLVKNTDAEFPFCGARCRLIDLGKWASGQYVISSPLADISDSVPEADPGDEKGDS